MPIDPEEITQPITIFYNQFIEALPSIIAAMVVFILTLVFAVIARQVVRRALRARTVSNQVVLLLSKLTYWSVIVFGTVVALQQVNFNLTAFLTGLGIVGFTIGFALQDVSKNFVSGLLLLIQQPFSVGDAIEVAGFAGTVIAIDLRATEMHTFDGRVVLIPNADVFTNPITNFTRAARRRVDIKVGVAYGTDLDLAQQTALEAVDRVPGAMKDPAPWLNYETFGDSSINFTVFFWVNTGENDLFVARSQAMKEIKRAYQKLGIDIPFPTQVVYNYNGESEAVEPQQAA